MESEYQNFKEQALSRKINLKEKIKSNAVEMFNVNKGENTQQQIL